MPRPVKCRRVAFIPQMNISRPTSGMLFAKIAGASLEVVVGAAVVDAGVTVSMKNIEIGSDFMPKVRLRRFICVFCGHEFEALCGLGQNGEQLNCPVCGGMVHGTNNLKFADANKSSFSGKGFGKRTGGGVTSL